MYPDPTAEKMAYQQLGGAIQGGIGRAVPSPPKDANPDALTSKLNQLIYGMNGCLHTAMLIGNKIYGSSPETGAGISNISEPPALQQADMLLGKVTQLSNDLENILRAL